MKKAIEELEKILKEKALEKNDFTPVIDILIKSAEENEQRNVDYEKVKQENEELSKTITTKEKENEELSKTITTKEKELADLKIKYIERFNDNNEKIGNGETNKEDISINQLFEEVK